MPSPQHARGSRNACHSDTLARHEPSAPVLFSQDSDLPRCIHIYIPSQRPQVGVGVGVDEPCKGHSPSRDDRSTLRPADRATTVWVARSACPVHIVSNKRSHATTAKYRHHIVVVKSLSPRTYMIHLFPGRGRFSFKTTPPPPDGSLWLRRPSTLELGRASLSSFPLRHHVFSRGNRAKKRVNMLWALLPALNLVYRPICILISSRGGHCLASMSCEQTPPFFWVLVIHPLSTRVMGLISRVSWQEAR